MELKNCPICEGTKFSEVLKSSYFRGKPESFSIQECHNCELWFTNPRPNDEELATYYESEDYVSHTDKKESFIDKVYHLVRSKAVKSKVALIGRFANKGRLLDYGAGTGFFLQAAKKDAWEVYGAEPSEVARKNAKEVHGLDLEDPANLDWETMNNSLDAISLWHVLEHLSDLKGDFEKFTKSLKTGGHLFIAVPNHESYDAQYYGENWAALDVPLHLYHFKKDNIKDLAKDFGFDLIETKNMPFDSYYVSMISEKIKNGKGSLFSAFRRGFMSNQKGKANKNASSLIYILKKAK